MKKLIAVVCILILTTCSTSPTSAPTLLPTVTLTGVPTSSRTAAPTTLPNPISPLPTSVNNTRAGSPTPGVTLSPTPENTTTPTQPPFQVCSPLQDITLAELPSILTTPFQAPTPGQDNGHHGADFAYYHRGSHTTMLGLPVLSSLSGRVAAVIHDRPPYGNAIIIETPFSSIPAEFIANLNLQTQPTPAVLDGRLTCPTPESPIPTPQSAIPTQQSLYLLYAHLNTTPQLAVGDSVTCGQPIGEVGTTGNSVNPHLHLETRLGPSGTTFKSLAHYFNTATTEEMSNYCTWRIGGLFQAFDPLRLFTLPNR